MKRRVSESLLEWKNSFRRMPLIINGARQVGKTYIVEQFGEEHYENVLYLNMEKLAEEIKSHYANNEAMPEALHEVALDMYKKYFIVGGMPAAVTTFIETESYLKIQPVVEKYKSPYSIRISKKNFGFEHRIKSVPLYAVFCI